jgi:exo-beta-1,3-glucanase (GH17 family)
MLAAAFFVAAPTAAAATAGSGVTSYFAEGYTGGGFQEYICIGNQGGTPAAANVTYMFNGGGLKQATYTVPAASRFTIDVNREVGAGKEVSARIESDSSQLVVERSMYFKYSGKWSGRHDVFGAAALSRTWYFAEGFTGSNFDEYVCVLNPGDSATSVTFRFQTAGGEVVRSGLGVGPHSRATFKVNDLLGQGVESSLALESDLPVVAERPTYFLYAGRDNASWQGGHCVLGAPSLSKEFFFGEGTTRAGFQEWLTIQNPNEGPVSVSAVYQLGPGQGDNVNATYSVEGKHRFTVYVPSQVGTGKDVSVKLSSTSDFLAERPMYYHFERTGLRFEGGHCAIGAANLSQSRFFAEGYTGPDFEEWLLLQNCSGTDSSVQVSYFTQEAGALAPRNLVVPANTRMTVCVNCSAGPNYQVATGVNVTAGPGVVVEREQYYDSSKWSPPQAAAAVTLTGLCFSPYLNEDPIKGQSVSPERISGLLDVVSPYVGWVRTFCSEGEWSTVPAMAKQKGLKIAAGADIYTDRARNQSEVNELIGQIRSGSVDIAVVGDEVIDTGALTEPELAGYIRQVRAAGVPTGTSETYGQWMAHPELVNECDVLLVNMYPYWEGVDVSKGAAQCAAEYQNVKNIAGGRRIIIETGWPTGGQTRWAAVPGPDNAARYLKDFATWASASGIDYFYFEAFDEQWKASREGPCGSCWGLWDSNGNLKPQIANVITTR